MKKPPNIQRFSAAKQRRLDELLDKNREATITSKEKEELKKLVIEAEQVMAGAILQIAAELIA